MKSFIPKIVVLLIVLALIVSTGSVSAMQPPPQPDSPDRSAPQPGKIAPNGAQQAPDGRWYMTTAGAQPDAPQTTGGPDAFGYTWNDANPYSWIDVTGGTGTGMSGYSSGQAVGPITLPFPFKFYENTYTSLYIAASGYLSFTPASYWEDQSQMVDPYPPNNIIAPYWTPTYISSGGWVRYKSGGSAPNRYFVVEWHDLRGGDPSDPYGADELYRFEALLYENGDVVFNYHTMTFQGGYWCGDDGIEDIEGLDGFSIDGWCNQVPLPNTSYRIYRPALAARVKINPKHDGRLAIPGEAVRYVLNITNTGDLGTDTLDLSTVSSWPVQLYQADGTTPLGDSDGDGKPDTGLLAQGASKQVIAKVQVPQAAVIGDSSSLSITVMSTIDTNRSKVYPAQTAVPAAFAQTLTSGPDYFLDVLLAHPSSLIEKSIAPDYITAGYDMAIAELPHGGFVQLWNRSFCGTRCHRELLYTLLDASGTIDRPPAKLTDHSFVTMSTYDDDIGVAITPDGHSGVTWVRRIYNNSNGQNNYNVYMAILEPNGSLGYGPINLTNNNLWGSGGTLGVPQFYDPSIAATEDGRFVLAWSRNSYETGGWLVSVYYSIIDSQNSTIVPLTDLTGGSPGVDQYYSPTVAGLKGNRALLAYGTPYSIAYRVINSGGGAVKPETSAGIWGYQLDAVQLSGDNILLAYTGSDGVKNIIGYLMLDGVVYNPIISPQTLTNPAALTDEAYMSVAADSTNRAVLTWTDYSYRKLYYALVNGSGNLVTSPMIYKMGSGVPPEVYTSFNRSGITSFHPWVLYNFLPAVMK